MTGLEIALLSGCVLVLIVMSGFFSGSETGLTAISRGRIHALEKEGNSRARMVSDLRKDKERLIGTILLGNNLVNIGASALSTTLAMQLFGYEGVAVATFILTLLIIIFAEVLPKTYALQNSDRTALWVAPVFVVLVKLSYPFTSVVSYIVRKVFYLFGLHKQAEGLSISGRAALRGAIELQHTEGDIRRHDRDMLGSILDLEDVEVKEAMIHRTNMITIDADLPPKKIIDHVMKSNHTRIPLWEGSPDEIIGILHARDVLQALRTLGHDLDTIEIRSLARDPWFIPETTSLKDQLQAFRKRNQHFALVVDEYGSLEGLITLEDILEEIVGQIHDEHDPTATGIRPQKDGSTIVRGDVTLRDLNRRFDWSLPDEDAATLAGLIIHEARIIPEKGETFIFHGFSFEIMQKDDNQITLIRTEKLPEADDDDV